MLPTILNSEIKKKNLSVRSAAKKMGVAHTTLIRAMNGDHLDLPTIVKISKWLGIDPSDVVDTSGAENSEGTEMVIGFLSLNPSLKNALIEATRKVQSGEVDPHVIEDVLAYLAFRLLISQKPTGKE